MKKPIQLEFIYSNSNRFSYAQLLKNGVVEMSIRSDKSYYYTNSYKIFFESNFFRNDKNFYLVLRLIKLYNDNKISYLTFLTILKKFNINFKVHSKVLKNLTEFCWESGFVDSKTTKLDFIKKTTN